MEAVNFIANKDAEVSLEYVFAPFKDFLQFTLWNTSSDDFVWMPAYHQIVEIWIIHLEIGLQCKLGEMNSLHNDLGGP